jgi:N-methylhydantoinase A
MPAVLVPPDPGAFSALGMATADVVQDASVAFLRPLTAASRRDLAAAFVSLGKRLRRSLSEEGFREPDFIATVDLRYRGQSFEIALDLPLGEDLEVLRERFHEAHERLYHARHPERAVEAVTLRLRAIGRVGAPRPRPARRRGTSPKRALDETTEVRFAEGARRTAFYSRDRLAAGNRFDGPAIVTETTGTTVVPPGWRAEVDLFRNLLLTEGGR